MKRTALRLALCAAVGALLTAAAALLCALVMPGERIDGFDRYPAFARDTLLEGISLPKQDEVVEVYGERHCFVGCIYTDVYASPAVHWGESNNQRSPFRFGLAMHCDAGWPLPCLHSVVQPAGPYELGGRWSFWQKGTWLPRTYGPVVDFRILWPGAAADVLLFGAIAWGVGAGCVLARRIRRRRRGLCPACAYSRAGLPPAAPCPECGKTT